MQKGLVDGFELFCLVSGFGLGVAFSLGVIAQAGKLIGIKWDEPDCDCEHTPECKAKKAKEEEE